MGSTEVFILAGALAGGFINGLTGFGTGLTALTFWLVVVPPIIAAPLVAICSVIGQLQTLPSIWHAIIWRRVLPFIIGGLVGVPIGTLLLPMVSVQMVKLLVGGFLIVISSLLLMQRSAPKITWGGQPVDGFVGFLGGILGGLIGLSGVPPTLWASLKGWSKHEKRAVFQTFNLSILLFAAASMAYSGFLTAEVGRYTLIALPGTLLGVWLGRKTYNHLSDERFQKIVLGLLLLAGISTIASVILAS